MRSGCYSDCVPAPPIEPLLPDPVIEAFKKDVDRTLLRARLALTPEERLLSLQRALEDLDALRAGLAASRP